MLRLTVRTILFALFTLLPAGPALAHPHIWIEMDSDLVFTPEGAVRGLAVTWRFDEMYSIFATEGFDSDGDGTPDAARLDELAADMMQNLSAYDYFTHIRVGGKPAALQPPGGIEVSYADGRLEARFTVSLSEPADPAAGIRYGVFDPTYYVEIAHRSAPAAHGGTALPDACATRLEPPAPPRQMSLLAASLDRSESAGDELGAHFAEWVAVDCAGDAP